MILGEPRSSQANKQMRIYAGMLAGPGAVDSVFLSLFSSIQMEKSFYSHDNFIRFVLDLILFLHKQQLMLANFFRCFYWSPNTDSELKHTVCLNFHCFGDFDKIDPLCEQNITFLSSAGERYCC